MNQNHLENFEKKAPIKAERISNDLLNGEMEAPIDLSRHCDSVETRKTPSPYNSSAFGSSPGLLNESPTSGTMPTSLHVNRGETPTICYNNGYSRNCSSNESFQYEDARTITPEMQSFPNNANNMTDEEINAHIFEAFQKNLSNLSSNMTTPTPENYPMLMGPDGKMTRPFKIYPRDPLTLSASIAVTDSLNDRMSIERFNAFRQKMLQQIHAANGGRATVTNPRMRRHSMKSVNEAPQQMEGYQSDQQQTNHSDSTSNGTTNNKEPVRDSAYYERRRKNNAAAKKSRDRRRIKEDEIAIRAAFLERENIELKIELAAIKRQLTAFLNKQH